jgi:signal transduction histidine kinase
VKQTGEIVKEIKAIASINLGNPIRYGKHQMRHDRERARFGIAHDCYTEIAENSRQSERAYAIIFPSMHAQLEHIPFIAHDLSKKPKRLWPRRPRPELDRKNLSSITTRKASTRWLAFVALALIPLAGLAEHTIGPQTAGALLYIPPVAIAAWLGGRRFGLLAAIASAAIGFTAAIQDAHKWSPLTPCYNAILQLCVGSFVALLVSAVRKERNEFKRQAEADAAALEREIANRKRLESEFIEIAARTHRELAHDLHDNLGQHLVCIALRTKLLEENLRPLSPRHANELAELVQLTRDAMKQTKITARNLERADVVGDLQAALQRLVADVQQSCDVTANLKTDSRAVAVPSRIATQLYRIAQEAVHNAVEHGGTKTVQIDLASDENEIVLSVHDNGHGFEASAATEGMGLRSMRYRAESIGGSCEVRSSRGGGGTTVTCHVRLCPAMV